MVAHPPLLSQEDGKNLGLHYQTQKQELLQTGPLHLIGQISAAVLGDLQCAVYSLT